MDCAPSSQQPQQLLLPPTEHGIEDYLQVLDAGEHMFGMFVSSTSDEDLCAYLGDDNNNTAASTTNTTTEEPFLLSWNLTEDIEDVISRSIGPPNIDALPPHPSSSICLEGCCPSFADLHIHDTSGGNKNSTRDDDAMSQ